jgi:predicted acetyltransferase
VPTTGSVERVEIRAATADEMPAVRDLLQLGLGEQPESFAALEPAFTLCAFADEELAAVHGSWPLTMRFNGKPVPISGVTAVSTAPIHRQRGHLRALVTRHFEELHEGGERPLAVLFATQAAIYQRFGYAVISTHHEYRVEPRFLAFAEPLGTPGRLRYADPSPDAEFGLLVALYRAFREPRNGLVHRGRPMWEAGVLAPATASEVLSTVVYEEDGEPLGYCVYVSGPRPGERGDRAEPGHRTVIRDLAWLNPRAYRALWTHLASMHLSSHVEWRAAPADDPLPHLLLEPRMLRARAHEGMLARIVDLAGCVSARPFPERTRLRFELVDPLCPWNAGAWAVVTSEAGGELAPLAGESPELTLGPGTLAMLLFGQLSATEAARAGRLDVHDESALRRWDAAMRTEHRPFSPDIW